MGLQHRHYSLRQPVRGFLLYNHLLFTGPLGGGVLQNLKKITMNLKMMATRSQPIDIDSFTKNEILDEYGRTNQSWIHQCYLHRMKEILSDPTEFGKAVLREKNRDHCIQDEDLEGY